MDETIKVTAAKISHDENYLIVNKLLETCIAGNTLPFTGDCPMPLDKNLVSGHHFGDANSTVLQLKAASIGAKSLSWIYGADAATLGLELKSGTSTDKRIRDEYAVAKKANPSFDSEPFIVFANLKDRSSASQIGIDNEAAVAAEGMQCDAQCAYLLDQFTDESIRRCLSPLHVADRLRGRNLGNEYAAEHSDDIAGKLDSNKPNFLKDSLSRQRSFIHEVASNDDVFSRALAAASTQNQKDYLLGIHDKFVKTYCDYDQDELARNERQYFYDNFKANDSNPSLAESKEDAAAQALSPFGKEGLPEASDVFNKLYRFRIQQITGRRAILGMDGDEKNRFNDSFRSLMRFEQDGHHPGAVYNLVAGAQLYADRMMHPGFSLDQKYDVYEAKKREELISRSVTRSPESIINDRYRSSLAKDADRSVDFSRAITKSNYFGRDAGNER